MARLVEKKGITIAHGQPARFPVRALAPSARLADAIALHWLEYLFEGIELGTFMFAACVFGTLLFYTRSPLVSSLPSATLRLVLMGSAMGATAIRIILSPLGRRSGAHFNPAVSLTFLWLGRMHRLDAMFYVVAQFIGGALGVLLARILLGADLASPSVRYVVTVPGRYGVGGAWPSECFMGLLLMTVVLQSGNSVRLARISWLLVGMLVAIYVIVFSPVSGFSLNPREPVFGSVCRRLERDVALLSAPLSGMLLAAVLYVEMSGPEAVLCAKIYHDLHSPCPFRCRFMQPEPSTPVLGNAQVFYTQISWRRNHAIEQPPRSYHHRNRRRRSNTGAPACSHWIEDSHPRARGLRPP